MAALSRHKLRTYSLFQLGWVSLASPLQYSSTILYCSGANLLIAVATDDAEAEEPLPLPCYRSSHSSCYGRRNAFVTQPFPASSSHKQRLLIGRFLRCVVSTAVLPQACTSSSIREHSYVPRL